MHREQPPRERRREAVKRRAHCPLQRALRPCSRALREEPVDAQRQRVLELAGDPQARLCDEPPRGCAIEPLQVADLDGVLALAGAPRRDVRLERHLDEHGARRSRDLGEQRCRLSHVLEHVRDDAQVIGAVGVRQVLAVVARDRFDLRALPRDRDGRVGDLDAAQRAAESACVQLAQQRAVAAADLERALRPQAGALAQRDHVLRLADRSECAPARVDGSLLGIRRIRPVVEADQLGAPLRAWLSFGRQVPPPPRQTARSS